MVGLGDGCQPTGLAAIRSSVGQSRAAAPPLSAEPLGEGHQTGTQYPQGTVQTVWDPGVSMDSAGGLRMCGVANS